jgi:hypothetical protein
MVMMNLDLGGQTALVSGMTTTETSQGRLELQIGFVRLGKIGRPGAISAKTTVRGLWGWDIVEEALL